MLTTFSILSLVLAFLTPEGSQAPRGCYHEPPSYEPIFDQAWDSVPPVFPQKDSQGWFVRKEFERKRLLSIVQDPSAPLSPPGVIQALFPQGSPGGRGPFRLNRRFGRPYSEFYLCMSTKLDSRFTNNGNSGTKFGFILTPYKTVGPYINLTPRMGINMESRKGQLNRNMFGSFSIQRERGVWHRIELIVTGNQQGLSNGTVQMWADDRLVLNLRDVKFFYPDQEPAFEGITWNPTYGGGRNPVPYDMYQWIDHWYMSGI